MGILNSKDGNYSQVVTIHGGYVYDANEVHAIHSQEKLVWTIVVPLNW